MEDKQFIKQGSVRALGLDAIPVPVLIILRHTGEYFYYIDSKGCKHILSGKYSDKKPKGKKMYKSEGAWFVYRWAYETVRNDGGKDWWYVNDNEAQLIEVLDKEDVQALLEAKEVVSDYKVCTPKDIEFSFGVSKYRVQSKYKDTGSNYNLFSHVFNEKGECLFGTSFKNDTPETELKEWAVKGIVNYFNRVEGASKKEDVFNTLADITRPETESNMHPVFADLLKPFGIK